MSEPIVRGPRTRIEPATHQQLFAMAREDRGTFARLLGVDVPEPLEAPPLTSDVIEWFATRLADDPDLGPWFFRWIIDEASATLVGSAGFGGRPDDEGAVVLGYSIYPPFEGVGYASEAATALTDWALEQPGVELVRATIPPGHVASQRVSAKAGLVFQSMIDSDDEGPLQVWERRRALD